VRRARPQPLRTLLGLLALAALARAAGAQIVEVELATARAAGTARSLVLERDGRPCLRGELTEALDTWLGPGGALLRDGGTLGLFTIDPADPEDVAYRLEDGVRRARKGQRRVEIEVADVRALRLVGGRLPAWVLAQELGRRERLRKALEARRDREPAGTPAWLALQRELVDRLRSTQRLLRVHGFDPAADAREKDVARALRGLGPWPAEQRLAAVRASPRRVDTPAALVAAAQEISGGADVFTVHASTHLRIVQDGRLGEARALELLGLGEEVLEGLTRAVAEAHGCARELPARVFAEFWFGPDGDDAYRRYFERYYGLDWGEGSVRARRLEASGTYPVRSEAPELLSYYRAGRERDPLGLVAHRVGEHFAQVHFEELLERGPSPRSLDWVTESFGLHAALELLGTSTTSCTSFLERSLGAEEEARRRDPYENPAEVWRARASGGRPVGTLVAKDMAELTGADVAYGRWVLIAAEAEGEPGLAPEVLHRVLHALGEAARTPETFLARWGAALAELLEVQEGDPVAALEARLRVGPAARR